MELRVLAHLSGDEALVALLRQAGAAGDAFNLIASTWLGSGAGLPASQPASQPAYSTCAWVAISVRCLACAAIQCLSSVQDASVADGARAGSPREGREKAPRTLPCPARPLLCPRRLRQGSEPGGS